ncbi:stage II sporulation protein M [Chloroflexota bacterium]
MSYKKWVFIAIVLFGIGLACGLTTPTSIISLFYEDITVLQELIVPFNFLTVILIFLKNASALLLSFALSPILCLMPILALILNGWLIAFISVVVIQVESLSFVLAGLIPHGIFELPAFILGEAAALSFGAMIIITLFKKEKRNLLLPSLKQNFRYLMIALVLLVPAAIIEVYITPLLLT